MRLACRWAAKLAGKSCMALHSAHRAHHACSGLHYSTVWPHLVQAAALALLAHVVPVPLAIFQQKLLLRESRRAKLVWEQRFKAAGAAPCHAAARGFLLPSSWDGSTHSQVHMCLHIICLPCPHPAHLRLHISRRQHKHEGLRRQGCGRNILAEQAMRWLPSKGAHRSSMPGSSCLARTRSIPHSYHPCLHTPSQR